MSRSTQQNLGDLMFALCVNFLLYCALIIVFYMLITFYLEEETSQTQQGYSKVATREDGEQEEEEEDDEEEDDEDEEDDKEEEVEEKKTSDNESDKGLELVERKKPGQSSLMQHSPQAPSHDSPYTIVSGRKSLSSPDLLSASIGAAVEAVTSIASSTIAAATGSNPKAASAAAVASESESGESPELAASVSASGSSSSSVNLSSQSTLTKMIRKVVFYAMGLITTFSIWGIVQERMLTQPYDGVYFKYSYGLIFLNRLGGLLLSVSLMSYFRVAWVHSPLWEYSFPSVANMLSSWCQYEALKYVSFPTQTLSKAFKVVPVM